MNFKYSFEIVITRKRQKFRFGSEFGRGYFWEVRLGSAKEFYQTFTEIFNIKFLKRRHNISLSAAKVCRLKDILWFLLNTTLYWLKVSLWFGILAIGAICVNGDKKWC